MRNISPILLALVCVFAWSFIPVVSKLGQLHIDSFQFLFWTNFLSALAVGLTIKPSKKHLIETIKQTNYKQTVLLGFLGCFFYYLCLYYGYAHGNTTDVLVVQYLWPALVPVFAVLFLKERLNVYKVVSIVLGFFAAVIVFTKGDVLSIGFSGAFVLLTVFVGATSFALFSVFSKMEHRVDVSFSVFMYFLWASIFSFISIVAWSNLVIPDLESVLIILVNGVFINGLSYILWVYALSKEDASKIAPLVYISPVLSVVWISLIFGDSITVTNITAVALVVASGLLVTTEDKFIPRHITKVFSRHTKKER
ncbi:MAG: EamA family transporter [Proteobacteria bacterium]|nr:MAG: EamA family transporter [Pseudomonadota bacterium]